MPVTAERMDSIITPEVIANLSEDELEEMEFFSMFLETLVIIEGKKGSGKTQLSIALLKKLNKYFKTPVVTDQKLKSAFGPYMFLDEKTFVEEIQKTSDIAKSIPSEDMELVTEWALRKLGIKLEGAVILFDEGYKYFDCRKPTDKLVLVFGYFIATMRHYHATVIICVPNRRYLDKRVRDQIDFLAKVAYNMRTEFVHARFLDYSTGEVHGLKVYGPNYRNLYDSWSPISFRRKVLDIHNSL